jgi:hypothetical protein
MEGSLKEKMCFEGLIFNSLGIKWSCEMGIPLKPYPSTLLHFNKIEPLKTATHSSDQTLWVAPKFDLGITHPETVAIPIAHQLLFGLAAL